jgi:hypothetical protein
MNNCPYFGDVRFLEEALSRSRHALRWSENATENVIEPVLDPSRAVEVRFGRLFTM